MGSEPTCGINLSVVLPRCSWTTSDFTCSACFFRKIHSDWAHSSKSGLFNPEHNLPPTHRLTVVSSCKISAMCGWHLKTTNGTITEIHTDKCSVFLCRVLTFVETTVVFHVMFDRAEVFPLLVSLFPSFLPSLMEQLPLTVSSLCLLKRPETHSPFLSSISVIPLVLRQPAPYSPGTFGGGLS